MHLGALEPADERQLECRVAGPVALLIAKAHKIADRLGQVERPDRLRDKDAADVFRLMQTTPIERSRTTAAVLLNDARVAESSRRGIDLLCEQFGAPRAAGVQMATRALRVGVPEARVRTVCTQFVAQLREVV